MSSHFMRELGREKTIFWCMVATMHQWGLPREAMVWARTFDYYETKKKEMRTMEGQEEDVEYRTEGDEEEVPTGSADEAGATSSSETENEWYTNDEEEDIESSD